MIAQVLKRDGRLVPFDKRKITFAIYRAAVAVGGRDESLSDSIADRVIGELEKNSGRASPPSVEEIQDCVEKTLIESGHARTAKAYILYRYEHALKRQGKDNLTYSAENIPYRKLWEALLWGIEHRCAGVAELNARIAEGSYPDLVREADAFYEGQIDEAAAGMEERLEDLRLVIVAGPSSSGKSTTTAKLAARLAAKGRRLVPVNADNYFFDLETHPKDIHGDYDFETPQALDLDLLNAQLKSLVDGGEVDIPKYDFKLGKRNGTAETLRLGPDDVLLLDSLHGLFEKTSESVPASRKFRVYIETLSQLRDGAGAFVRWADVRMLRRMIRDKQFRNYNPRETLLHWYLVRRSELHYIVSRLRSADAVINSYLPYELPILKSRLEPLFPSFIAELESQPDREDALLRARRVRDLFAGITAWTDESVVAPDSLLREFIGGGTLGVH